MNLAQMRIAVKDMLMAGGGQNSNIATDPFWSDNEINRKINLGQQFTYNAIRRARQDYFIRIMNTTDPMLTIFGQSFSPASLAWVPGQTIITLPPDFARMLSITDLTASTAADRIRITMSRIEREEFRIIMNESSGNDLIREYYGAILGVNQLLIRPVPNIARDWQFIYEKKLPVLRDWAGGQVVSLSNGGTVVTFSAGADCQNHMVVGDELVLPINNTLNNTSNALISDPNRQYPVIASVDGPTQVTLAGPYFTDDLNNLANCPYICSSVSEIPYHHHETINNFAVVELFKKGPNPSTDAAKGFQETFNMLLQALIDEVESRQGMDKETASAYLEDTYYGSWW